MVKSLIIVAFILLDKTCISAKVVWACALSSLQAQRARASGGVRYKTIDMPPPNNLSFLETWSLTITSILI